MSLGIVASAHVPFGGAFSPTDVAGLAAWWDATQLTGYSNDDDVPTFPDSSGNSNEVSDRGTGLNNPSYASTGINSLPALKFTRGNLEFLHGDAGSAGDLDLTGNFLIAVVVRFDTVKHGVAAQSTILSKYFDRWELAEYQGEIQARVGGVANTATSSTSGTLLTTGTTYVILFRRTSTSAVTIRVNGTQVASATNSASNTGTYAVSMGVRPGASASFYLNGWVGEAMVYDQDVSSSDVTSIENYLTDRWT